MSHLQPQALTIAKAMRLLHYIPRALWRPFLMATKFGSRRSKTRYIVRANIRLMHPELSSQQRQQFEDEVLDSLRLSLVEILVTSSMTWEELQAWCVEIVDPTGWLTDKNSSATIAYFAHGSLLDSTALAMHMRATAQNLESLLVVNRRPRASKKYNRFGIDRLSKIGSNTRIVSIDSAGVRQLMRKLDQGGSIAVAADIVSEIGDPLPASLFGNQSSMAKLWHTLQIKYKPLSIWIRPERIEFLKAYRLHIEPIESDLAVADPHDYSRALSARLERAITDFGSEYWYYASTIFKGKNAFDYAHYIRTQDFESSIRFGELASPKSTSEDH